jgi:4'-phosphopantetheinyl transferase
LHFSQRRLYVFCAGLDLPAPRLHELERILAADERERAGRFRMERDRNRFVAGRGQLRELLGSFLQVPPATLSFEYGKFGKPSIAAPVEARVLHFNLAHSGAWAVYAMAKVEVGVDIEEVRPVEEAQSIAERMFATSDAAWLRSLPANEQVLAFFNCWTRTEALAKADGLGLSDWRPQAEGLMRIDGRPPPLSSAAKPQIVGPWSLQSFEPAAGYVAAWVARGHDLEVSFGPHFARRNSQTL